MNRHSAERGARPGARSAASRALPARTREAAEGKRERIMDAAVHVFAHKGFYNSKISEIAREAGVADGTIYLYFKSKDDLLISLFESRMERVNETLASAMAECTTAPEKIRRFVATHLQLVSANRDQAEVLTVELRQSSKFIKEYANPRFAEFLKLLGGVIEDGQKKGELSSAIRPQLAARALFGAVDELALWWVLRGDAQKDLERAAGELCEMFLGGLASQESAPAKRRAP